MRVWQGEWDRAVTGDVRLDVDYWVAKVLCGRGLRAEEQDLSCRMCVV